MSLLGKAGKAVQGALSAQKSTQAQTVINTQIATTISGMYGVNRGISTVSRTPEEWVDYLKKYEDLPGFQEALKLMNSKLYKVLK